MSPAPLPASRWQFDPASWPSSDLVAIGADLEPATLVAAYSAGVFPMRVDGHLGWWSPMTRGVLKPGELHVSRSLRKSAKRFQISVDTAFDDVIAACAAPDRPHGWIGPDIQDAYRELHRLGWAHSVEARDAEGRLAGGLYGVAIGGLFAGESMFHRQRDASKVALMALVDLLGHERLIDVQWQTPHLASLGVTTLSRREYLARLPALCAGPLPPIWSGSTAHRHDSDPSRL